MRHGRRASATVRARTTPMLRERAAGNPWRPGRPSRSTTSVRGTDCEWPARTPRSAPPPCRTRAASTRWRSSRRPRAPRRSRSASCCRAPGLIDPTTPASSTPPPVSSDDHLHRRRRRHPALPRLPDRAAGGEVDLPGDQLPADLRRAAQPGAARRVHQADQPAHDAARGPQGVLRRLPARRAPDAGAVSARSPRCRPSTRTRWTRSTRTRSSSRPSGCWPSCRRSRPTPTRSRSASRSSTRTTRWAWSRTSCA